MDIFRFAVLALAIWRISNMLVNEDGPWMAFEHLRLRVGLQPAPCEECTRETDPPGQMPGSLFSCVWCLSVWVGAVVALLALLLPGVMFWLCMPFALSAVACLIDRSGGN